MNTYKAVGVVAIHNGRVTLSSDQAKRRIHHIKPKNKKQKEGVYEVLESIQFKIGETFGYDGEIPKSMAKVLVNAGDEDDNTEDKPISLTDVVIDISFLEENFPNLVSTIKESGIKTVEINLDLLKEYHQDLIDEIKEEIGEENKIDIIIEAIELLENENDDHWTEEGLPQVTAIESVMGIDITADERDEAVEKITKLRSLCSRLFEEKE